VALLSSYLARRRLDAAVPYLGKKVLDLGCGNARLLERVECLEQYTGMELHEDRVRRLRAHHPKWRFVHCDLEHEHLPLPEETFDTAALLAVIEHLAEPRLLLSECYRVLLPQGRLVITTPSPLGHRVHTLASWLGLTSRSAVHHHQSQYSKTALDAMVCSVGFEPVAYRRFLIGLNQLCVYQRPH